MKCRTAIVMKKENKMRNCNSDEKTLDCRNVFRQFSVCVVILEIVFNFSIAILIDNN